MGFSHGNGSTYGNPIATITDAGFVSIPKCIIVDYAPELSPNFDATTSRETEGARVHTKVRYVRKRNADLPVFEAGGLPTRDPKRRKTNRTFCLRAEERLLVLGERGGVGVGRRASLLNLVLYIPALMMVFASFVRSMLSTICHLPEGITITAGDSTISMAACQSACVPVEAKSTVWAWAE